MATQRVPALQFPSQPSLQQIPGSFQQALKRGWTIVKEETTTNTRGSKRKGVVLLQLKGASMRLRVPYTATTEEWKFGTPEEVE
jgi:hypothetical protein